jgi:hypothetical protein
MNSIFLPLRASIITLVLLTYAAFWVPIDFGFKGAYYHANLFNELEPRALLGTVARRILHLGPTAYILLRVLFEALWLFLIVFQITKSLRPDQDSGTSYTLEVVALSVLFGFNTVVYTTNGLSEFIDVVPYTLVLCAVPLLLPSDDRVTITRYFAATLLLLAAVMVHEKSVFDLAILAAWTTWKYGYKRSSTLMLPSAAGAVCYLWIVSTGTVTSGNRSPVDSIKLLQSALSFFGESLDVWGIILAGGVLWVIFIVAAYNFLKTRARFSLHGYAIIIIMIVLCFAPLSVADDTTRMVGLIWLPTYLLIREIDLKSALESVRFRQWALVACLLQVLLPPMLLYQHGVAPFSCYSRELISRFLPRERDITNFAVKPFGLYALDRGDLYDSIVCWPPRLIRLPRH